MKHLSKGEWVAVISVILLAGIAAYISSHCIGDITAQVITSIIESAKKREEQEGMHVRVIIPIKNGVDVDMRKEASHESTEIH
jgi:hypothetical protein